MGYHEVRSKEDYLLPGTDNGWIEKFRKLIPEHVWASFSARCQLKDGTFVEILVGVNTHTKELSLTINRQIFNEFEEKKPKEG